MKMELPASCSIAVIASSLDLARQVCYRIKAASHDTSPEASDTTENPISSINWNIKNKYYTADVQFKPIEVNKYGRIDLEDVPAIIYAWSHQEPYGEHLKALSDDLKNHDPEVLLAINVSHQTEDESAEDFLNENGFELIYDSQTSLDMEYESKQLEEQQGHSHLNRAVDALSTIMWPTMVQSPLTQQRKSKARKLFDVLPGDESADGMQALLDDSLDIGSQSKESGMTRMQRDLDQLEKWLEEDETSKNNDDYLDAWITRTTPSIAVSSAPDSLTEDAFDDDFTDFVSAYPSSLLSSDTGGVSYHTLSSVSDLGEPGDDQYTAIQSDTDEPVLPSAEEIQAATTRIYGPPQDAEKHLEPGPNDDFDFDAPAFDLSRVFSALQAMKEEIAEMSDEKEKRQAAARAALGLVYGLDIDGEDAERTLNST